MPNPQQKPSLADSIRQQLRRLGISVASAGNAIGENRTTVHTWLDRNVFPPDAVSRLAEIAGMRSEGLADLESRYSFSLSTPRERRSSVATDLPISDVALFRDAQDGDWLIRIAAVEPPEWHPSAWAGVAHQEMLAAIRRGAAVVYILPNDKEIARWRSAGDLPMLPAAGELGNAFGRFVGTVAREVRAKRAGVSAVSVGAGPFFFLFANVTMLWRTASDGAGMARELRGFLETYAAAEADQLRRVCLEMPTAYLEQLGRFAAASAATEAMQSDEIRAFANAAAARFLGEPA